MKASKQVKKYFGALEKETDKAYGVATAARKKGFDPEEKVDIPLAKGIAERVEGLVSALAPEILNSGVAKRILELEKEFGLLDWRVALRIAEEVAKEMFCKFESKLRALETGIRVGLAYITLGVISAPLEGFIELKLKKRKDGGEYFSAFYAGPIRAAGGTAEAVSIIIADYVRLKLGYMKYDPDESEIKRVASEIRDYHERATNLQYLPSEEEIVFLLRNLPIEINGDPTEEIEVSNHKDLPRIETNRIRGGVCLVLAEGLAQKAPKVYKQTKKWGKEMGLEWDFLSEFLEIQKKAKAKGADTKKDAAKISPNFTFIKDLVAGRPVLSFPMRYGGFRLRYGRTRVTGLAAAALHPQTMNVLNDYVATGTQLKIERPGKAAAIVPCDSIDGPIIRTKEGNVIKLDMASEKIKPEDIEKILFLGDILINYGDFSENNHKLVPAGYCQEWWAKELEKAAREKHGEKTTEEISKECGIQVCEIKEIFTNKTFAKIKPEHAFLISVKYNIALHPDFTYYYTNITKEELELLIIYLKKSKVFEEKGLVFKLVLPHQEREKEILEKIGLMHKVVNKEFIVIEDGEAYTLEKLLAGANDAQKIAKAKELSTTLETVSAYLGITIKDKAGTFIGARMGRPEKAKMRKLTGSPHLLFPVGDEGGRLRSIQAALEAKKITAEFPIFVCGACKTETIFSVCEFCQAKTQKVYLCEKCGRLAEKCSHDRVTDYKRKEFDIAKSLSKILESSKITIFPDLIKGVRGTSNKSHIPEHLLKGVLRAKHGIFVNKDGTTRYDMIEVPITHFKPKEIGTSVEKLKELGYLFDIHGEELTRDEQVLELFAQDLILPASPDSGDEMSDDCLFRVANFIDDLLVSLYNLPKYYGLKSKKDLVGELVVGLAPHTSAGTIGRIIGFSKTQGMFTHPMFHAAMRRNCDGDEACVILLMDALLNFSRSFLPDKRGSRTMDAPLVLTTFLIPGEVDSEVHGLDIAWEYPLELYEAAMQYKSPPEVKIQQIHDVLNTEKQYEGTGYTHELSSINTGVLCSAYKILPTMEDKLKGQMDLAEKISAVNAEDVAQLVIEKHFLKDIKGNLRKFSTQQFRCVACNAKFRRPPLAGKCTACGGKLIFTISEGSIIKYLAPTLSLAKKYKVSSYLAQSLAFLEKQVESVLGKDKEKQEALGKWFG